MKSFLKQMLVVFGIVVVVFVALSILLISGKLMPSHIIRIVNFITSSEIITVSMYIVSVILGILAVLSIAFSGNLTQDIKGGIILPLKVGNVHISNQTFENIALNVAKKYDGLKTVRVAVKVKDTGTSVDVFAYVLQDTVISEITEKIQKDIKETILKQTTVAVETVNVKIKGVYTINENKEI